MEIVSNLQDKYGINNPIFIDEIRLMFNNYSKIRVAQLIQESIASGKLARFENGIYYIPAKTIFGISTLSTIKVIEKKYIKQDEEVYGFYSGITFINNIGLTTQVPNIYEIMTNKESTRVRKVKIENQELVLRKSMAALSMTTRRSLRSSARAPALCRKTRGTSILPSLSGCCPAPSARI